ncbi:MAG TPA: NAD(P)H-binding protein [Kofleriaceae bacterium]
MRHRAAPDAVGRRHRNAVTLLIAGITSALGRAVAERALARGVRVRALVRDPARIPATLSSLLAGVITGDARDRSAADAALAGCDAVFSCVGASVLPTFGRGWRGFGAVDWPANRNLIDAARAAGASRFVYLSVFHHPDMRRLAYVDAHERVVDHLRASGLDFAVLRPTGFHSALASYVDLAARGSIPEVGRGAVRTNPIADEDLADLCDAALESSDPALEIACGGPEVLTRRAIGELAFAATGRAPRFIPMPALLMRAAALIGRPLHPRIAQFAAFLAHISTVELIAPLHGTRFLAGAFTDRARSLGAPAREPSGISAS